MMVETKELIPTRQVNIPILQVVRRAVIVVDMENLDRAQYELCGRGMDHRRFMNELALCVHDDVDVKVHYYVPGWRCHAQRFYSHLERCGFSVHHVWDDDLSFYNVLDRAIVRELSEVASDAQTIILVSGDGGYIGALDAMVQDGRRVIVASTFEKVNRSYLGRKGYTFFDISNLIVEAATNRQPL
jgi:hypothetical protein